MPLLSLIILIVLLFLGVSPLVYLSFGKAEGRPLLPPNALWLFELIEEVFDRKEVEDDGMSRSGQRENQDV